VGSLPPTGTDFQVFENYVEVLQVDDQAVELSLWDTAGEPEFTQHVLKCRARRV
jgi:GTPase SAR1 family protein